MVITTEMLGLIFLLVSAGALGLSLIHDVGRLTAEKGRCGVLRRQAEKKLAMIAEWTAKMNAYNRDIKAQQARFSDFNGRKLQLVTEIREIEAGKVELIHEIEGPDQGATPFWCRLVPGQGFKTATRQDVIFSRQIWAFRNVAHVNAFSADRALTLAQSMMGLASGILARDVVPLAMAPDGNEAQAEVPGGAPAGIKGEKVEGAKA